MKLVKNNKILEDSNAENAEENAEKVKGKESAEEAVAGNRIAWYASL